MENKGSDEFIWLGKSCHVLQSPGLGCDGVVCMHLNYSVMVRPEITRFRIWLCGLEVSSLKHDIGVVSCKYDNATTGCIQRKEFLGGVKDYYTSSTRFNSVKIISNSSFTKNHPNIRRHIIWATDSVVKYITDKPKANLQTG